MHEGLKREFQQVEGQLTGKILSNVREVNPKLFFLKKKLLQLRDSNRFLSEELQVTEKSRTHLTHEYSRLTKSLTSEEKTRLRISALEETVKKKDENIKVLKTLYHSMSLQLEEIEKDNSDRKDQDELMELQLKWSSAVAKEQEANDALSSQIAELEQQLFNLQSGNCRLSTGSSEEVRTELRRLECEITLRTDEVKQKERNKMRLNCELQAAKDTYEELKKRAPAKSNLKSTNHKNAASPKFSLSPQSVSPRPSGSPKASIKSPFSPAKSGLSALSSPSRRKKTRVSEEETKRRETLKQVKKVVAAGNSAKLVELLRYFGKPGQGLATKIIELNRGPTQ